ncbi:TetR/AcrR family transcriptional regulator [Anaerosinus gibii]|uniref:TetR/AcrR family transcriptional regulator n=1 Tax=Selenobaculum gibii TaxID=3054208 RepID=A0A9Y2AK20_9FIRM|nr:TetR/AcrR family transcriptional regulator [Selenobaculum gbiensis]WIW71546.1 TetR/AcrR family transcriptional regulator [Selenobaculum gbiensis]
MDKIKDQIDLSDPKNKRQHILDAAYIVFSRKGFHRATVDEIIKLADTGKGTVYNYFINKENLFYTLIEERSAPFRHHISNIKKDNIPPLEKIRLMTREFLSFYDKHADLWRVFMHEVRCFGEVGYPGFSEEQQKKCRRNFEEPLETLEAVIKEGIEQGLLIVASSKQAAYGLLSAILAIVFQKLIGDEFDQTAENIARVFLFGIANK